MRRGAVSAVVFVALLGGLPSAARWRDLVPIPFENHIYLDLYGFREHDSVQYGAADSRWDDTFFREKLMVSSSGYFYHPRFLQYQASLGESLKQELYDASGRPGSGWRRGSSFEYDTRLIFLPEHFYNLELFALQYEPLLREQSATGRNGMQRSQGGFFRYRRKPWFAHLRFEDDLVDSGTTRTDSQRINVGGEYFRRFREGNQFSLTANVNPTRFNTSQGIEGTSYQNVVSGSVDVRRAKLIASVSDDGTDQSGSLSGAIKSDNHAGYALLTAYLPLRFRTDVSYRRQWSDNSVLSPSDTAAREFEDEFREFQLSLVQRLFESLDTTYILRRDERTSTGGDSDSVSNQITLNYTKTIVRGRVLAGVNLGRVENDSCGRTDVVNEPHDAIAVAGRFTLGSPNADRSSIVVYFKASPVELVMLVENTHYRVTEVGATFEIFLQSLPPEYVALTSADLSVSYSVIAGCFDMRTDTTGYNLSVELLDRLLTPYYNFVAVRSDVLSGVFIGAPLDSTSHVVGLLVQEGRIRALTEFQKLDWAVSPFRAWRTEFQYIAAIDPTTNLYASASVLGKHFPGGASPYDPVPYTDRTVSATCNAQKQFARQNLLLSAGASYSSIRGRVDSESYSLNSSLTWKIGRVDLNAGLSAYSASSMAAAAATSHRDHGLLYVKVRRTF